MGITEYHNNDTLENTMQRADNTLYQEKDSGRNRVVSA
jgi:PleD family two-component response regulator